MQILFYQTVDMRNMIQLDIGKNHPLKMWGKNLRNASGGNHPNVGKKI